MREKRLHTVLLPLLAAALVLGLFIGSVARVEDSRRLQGRQQLEEALRRTAAACYACEGSYPPSVEHMREHYGLRYNEEEYTVIYRAFASNLMPEITVLEH